MIESYKIPERRREIVVVSHYYTAHGGGIERVAGQLIKEMADDERLHFTWAASDGDSSATLPNQVIMPMQAWNFIERFTGLPWPIWAPASLRRLHRAIATADLVWLHDTLYMGNLFAFLAARRLQKPIVITQHIGPIPYRNPFWRRLMAVADRLITQRMLRLAQQVTFISDGVAESYYRRVGFTMPVKIIPNGVDAELYRPAAAEKRRAFRGGFALRDDQPVLLFVGRFVEKKGLSVIRRLALLLPDWHFWLAGRGPVDPRQWFLPNVHVFRDRSGEALVELYQAADRLIAPGYGEGFPLVIQEAMACGLPVLCSPETAAGSNPAKPHLQTAPVYPNSPARTAAVWAEKLKSQRPLMPLPRSKVELADVAQIFWRWPKIAGHYADIFRALGRRAA